MKGQHLRKARRYSDVILSALIGGEESGESLVAMSARIAQALADDNISNGDTLAQEFWEEVARIATEE